MSQYNHDSEIICFFTHLHLLICTFVEKKYSNEFLSLLKSYELSACFVPKGEDINILNHMNNLLINNSKFQISDEIYDYFFNWTIEITEKYLETVC